MKGGIHPSVMGRQSVYQCVMCHTAVDISHCCPRCRLIPYCGEKCILQDHEFHSEWCKPMPKLSDQIPVASRVLIVDLKNTTHYNNCTGTMVKKDKDRYFVVLDGFLPTKILKVKLSNLKIIKLKRPELMNAEQLWDEIHEYEIEMSKEEQCHTPGMYVVKQSNGVIVREDISMNSPKTRELPHGTQVEIIKVEKNVMADRIRGQLKAGDWVSIEDAADGYMWMEQCQSRVNRPEMMKRIHALVALAQKYKSKVWKAYSLLVKCKLQDGHAYSYALQAVYEMREIGDIRGEAIALAYASKVCDIKSRHYQHALTQSAFMQMYICEHVKNNEQQIKIQEKKEKLRKKKASVHNEVTNLTGEVSNSQQTKSSEECVAEARETTNEQSACCRKTTGCLCSTLLQLFLRLLCVVFVIGTALYFDGFFDHDDIYEGSFDEDELTFTEEEAELLACLMNDNIENDVCASMAMKAFGLEEEL